MASLSELCTVRLETSENWRHYQFLFWYAMPCVEGHLDTILMVQEIKWTPVMKLYTYYLLHLLYTCIYLFCSWIAMNLLYSESMLTLWKKRDSTTILHWGVFLWLSSSRICTYDWISSLDSQLFSSTVVNENTFRQATMLFISNGAL
jgi:hypothetical protein